MHLPAARPVFWLRLFACLFAATAMLMALPATAAEPHNVLLFIADGLRYVSVTRETAPTLARIKREGVDFTNSHSLYPTITTVNASAIATGHYIGDTGNFGNQLYTGFTSPEAGNAMTPFVEHDTILGEMNDHFGGNYLNEESLLAAARRAGYSTAVFGKVGPTALQDVTARDGSTTIVIDDAIGTPTGLPISAELKAAMTQAGIALTAPKTALPNIEQQKYLLSIVTKVVLPKFKAANKPFVLVFWSRDPDATQHSAKDSLGKLIPGINNATAKAAIRNASDTLQALLDGLKDNGLDASTDVFVTADHGFSTIAKHSKTSVSAQYAIAPAPLDAVDIKKAALPPSERDLFPGFLAIDLADALGLPLYDANTQKLVDYKAGQHPAAGNGYLGNDPAHPEVIVVSNGGSDHIYVFGDNKVARAQQIVRILTEQDYVSGVFTNDALGEIDGALPLSAINLRGTALTPQPSIIVNFRSFVVPGCKPVLMCAAEVADTSLLSGQGMHGTFSRADTRNFMVAFGPSFKKRFADVAPISNADITPTLAQVLGLTIMPKGGLRGRVITEALKGGKTVAVTRGWQVSQPARNGLKTILDYQQVGDARYFDAAGFRGRTVGLSAH